MIDPGCIYCEEMSEEAEHTFFHCIKWQDVKSMLIEQIGEFTPAMLESEMKWIAVRRYVECVLYRKKVELDTLRENDT